MSEPSRKRLEQASARDSSALPKPRPSPGSDLTKTEHRQLLAAGNSTVMAYPQDKCLHELFEAQGSGRRRRVALVFARQQWTYRQLNERANQLAHLLRARGVEPQGSGQGAAEAVRRFCVGGSWHLESWGGVCAHGPSLPRPGFVSCGKMPGSKPCWGDLPNPALSWRAVNPVSGLAISGFSLIRFLSNPVALNVATDVAYVIYTSAHRVPKGVEARIRRWSGWSWQHLSAV